MIARQSLELLELVDKYDVRATVAGGGHSAQADAMRHGIARALTREDPERRSALKRAGFLTRDVAQERAQEVRSGRRSQALPVLEALSARAPTRGLRRRRAPARLR